MGMRNVSFREKLLLITYAFILLFVVIRFDVVSNIPGRILTLVAPFLVAIGLAFVLNRPMMFFRKLYGKKIKKQKAVNGLALLTAYLSAILIITGILLFIIPQVAANISIFINSLGGYIVRLEGIIQALTVKYELNSINLQTLFTELNDIVKNLANWILNYMGSLIPQFITITSNIVSVAFNFIVVIVVSANILANKEKILKSSKKLVYRYIPECAAKKIEKVTHLVSDIFGKYVVGQLTEACILGGLCFIGMTIFRFDYSILISVLVAVTALIPVAGAWIGGGVAFILLGIVSPIKGILFIVFFNILQQLENNLIYPKVVGDSIGLPGIFVMFAVVVGGGLFGLPGIMLSVPTMSVIYALFKEDIGRGNFETVKAERRIKKVKDEE